MPKRSSSGILHLSISNDMVIVKSRVGKRFYLHAGQLVSCGI